MPGFIYLSSITMVLESKSGKEGLVQIFDMFTEKSIAVYLPNANKSLLNVQWGFCVY